MDVGRNLILPFTDSTQVAAGNAQRVVLEVLVSKIMRKILRMQDRSFMYLTAVHTLSLPLLGGFQAALSGPEGFTATNLEQIRAAAACVPAVYASEYVVNTSSVGFHVPKPNLRDALVTAAAKVLTRPLIGNTIQWLPGALQTNFAEAIKVQATQNEGSRLKWGK